MLVTGQMMFITARLVIHW